MGEYTRQTVANIIRKQQDKLKENAQTFAQQISKTFFEELQKSRNINFILPSTTDIGMYVPYSAFSNDFMSLNFDSTTDNAIFVLSENRETPESFDWELFDSYYAKYTRESGYQDSPITSKIKLVTDNLKELGFTCYYVNDSDSYLGERSIVVVA